MSKYAELDELVLQEINCDVPKPFHKVHLGKIYRCCEELAGPFGCGFRVLDRRLQALRKAGKIKSVPGKGWIKLKGE